MEPRPAINVQKFHWDLIVTQKNDGRIPDGHTSHSHAVRSTIVEAKKERSLVTCAAAALPELSPYQRQSELEHQAGANHRNTYARWGGDAICAVDVIGAKIFVLGTDGKAAIKIILHAETKG